MNGVDIGQSKKVYLNALPLSLQSQIPVIEAVANRETYSKQIKPWLSGNPEIAYWTPRQELQSDTFTFFVTSIDSTLASVRQILEMFSDTVKVLDQKFIETSKSSVLLEDAIMKKFGAKGWNCHKRYGVPECRSPEPITKSYSFVFYRSLMFRVEYLGNKLVLVLLPRLKVNAPTLQQILEKFKEKATQKLVNRECIALHSGENRYRYAVLLNIQEVSPEKFQAELEFYDGVKVSLDPAYVRLPGNVLHCRDLIMELYNESIYRELVTLQRTHSFTRGPKESALSEAEQLVDEAMRIIKETSIFPFKLGGDVTVDIKPTLLEIS